MKTFTVQDLDGSSKSVLEACDREGAVLVRRPDGQTYLIRPEPIPSPRSLRAGSERWLESHLAWLKATFPTPVSREQTALVDKLIAGE